MRISLRHLFTFVTIVAIGVFSIDQYTFKTVAVEFSSPEAFPDPATLGMPPEGADYVVDFTIHGAPYSYSGIAYGDFGYNGLLSTELKESNISQFEDQAVMIKFRYRSLPWLPASQASDELDRHFLSVLVFPNAEEWQSIGEWR